MEMKNYRSLKKSFKRQHTAEPDMKHSWVANFFSFFFFSAHILKKQNKNRAKRCCFKAMYYKLFREGRTQTVSQPKPDKTKTEFPCFWKMCWNICKFALCSENKLNGFKVKLFSGFVVAGKPQQVQVVEYTEKSQDKHECRHVQLVREYGFHPRSKVQVVDGALLPRKFEPFPDEMYGRPLEEIDTFIYEEVSEHKFVVSWDIWLDFGAVLFIKKKELLSILGLNHSRLIATPWSWDKHDVISKELFSVCFPTLPRFARGLYIAQKHHIESTLSFPFPAPQHRISMDGKMEIHFFLCALLHCKLILKF